MNIVLEANILEEAGYKSAMEGLALNKKQIKDMKNVGLKLSKHDGGHNKFLEHMYIWVMVKAPRYWWQEADTVRISSKNSESTMHTLLKEINEGIQECDFEDIDQHGIDRLEEALNIEDKNKQLIAIKQRLPEGFLQKRMWCMSYKTLRNIILQRRTHRLPHWRMFIEQVLKQVQYPEFLPKLDPKEEK